jgi:hypothetical protein
MPRQAAVAADHAVARNGGDQHEFVGALRHRGRLSQAGAAAPLLKVR